MTTQSLLFRQEPLWLNNRQNTRHKLPENVQSWIYESGSVTQRLRRCYGHAVAVKVLFQYWRVPFLSERAVLKLPEHRVHLCREVLLHIQGKPLVLARTILPAATIKVAHRHLSQLGNRPLGEVIFSYPDLERLSLDVSLVMPSLWTPAVRDEINIDQPINGRRTVYAIAHRPMLVSEFFLPGVLVD